MLKLDTEQRNADALFHLAMIYETGFEGLVERSKMKSMSLLEEAANLGNPSAQVNLAQVFNRSVKKTFNGKGFSTQLLLQVRASYLVHTIV